MGRDHSSMASKVALVYVTTSDEEEARRIGSALVDKKLAACVNIIPGMRSIYRWQGKVVNDNECVMLVKAPKDNAETVIEKIKEMHSYEVPCVIVIPIAQGLRSYLDWIMNETEIE